MQGQYGPGQFAQGQFGPGVQSQYGPAGPGQYGPGGQQYGPGAQGQPGPGGGLASASPTKTLDVDINDNYFEPRSLNVQPGTVVRWTNRGKAPHTVTSADGRWGSNDIQPGGNFSMTFQFPGTYTYICRYHTAEKMQGTITVAASGTQPMPGGQQTPGATQPGTGTRPGTEGTDRERVVPRNGEQPPAK
jgi:plastocyanin